MAIRVQAALLALANLLIPVAVVVFAIGFFPYKPFLPGLAPYEDVPGYSGSLGAPFDKVVFMVVDALRSDFVYSNSSGFQFTQSLIRRKHALPYTAHATSPTITMPRVKALTTGSIPSFLDVILNFAESDTTSTLAGQDTWLAQLRARGRSATQETAEQAVSTTKNQQQENNLVFLGDDTWLKLFPGFFRRADGTSSFFVSDFTEVDNNVTRHIAAELQNSDWDALIMHYLGLDHIGHKAGPQSPNMLPKQREMDEIVETIYNAMTHPELPHLYRTLLVLCGDHGMNDGGNHGGSSEGETSPALTFISPLLEMVAGEGKESPTKNEKGECCGYYETVEQSDVVPTLAGLLGVPVPRNNLGVFVDGLLGFWDDEAQLQLILQNAWQILNIVQATFPHEDYNGEHVQTSAKSSSVGGELAFKWRKIDGLVRAKARGAQLRKEHLKPLIMDFLKSAQEILSSTASNYNITLLAFGIFASALAAIFAYFCVSFVWPPTIVGYSLTFVTLAYAAIMFASSYVEEEQHFWYWATSGWIVLAFFTATQSEANFKHAETSNNSLLTSSRIRAALLMVLNRMSTHWTTTGIKHAGAPSISSSFLPAHPYILWILIAFTYFSAAFSFSCRITDDLRKHDYSSALSLVRPGPQRTIELLGAPGGLAHAFLLAVVGLVFKINFTAAEAPELLDGMNWITYVAMLLTRGVGDLGLVAQARLVFGVLIIAVLPVVWGRWTASQGLQNRDNGSLLHSIQPLLTLFLITQSRAQNIPLFLFFDLERRLSEQLFHCASSSPTLATSTKHQEFVNGSTSSGKNSSTRYVSPNLSTSQAHIVTITLATVLFTYTSFFALGGSNTISSIDLSNAYNGVAGYEVGMVGVLVFFGNWAGPIWWSWQSWIWLHRMIDKPELKASTEKQEGERRWIQEEHKSLQDSAKGGDTNSFMQSSATSPINDPRISVNGEPSPFFIHLALLTLFTTTSLLAVQIACMALRSHLFIWTVFSPKYLYAMAWSCGWHLIWNCAFGIILWRSLAPR